MALLENNSCCVLISERSKKHRSFQNTKRDANPTSQQTFTLFESFVSSLRADVQSLERRQGETDMREQFMEAMKRELAGDDAIALAQTLIRRDADPYLIEKLCAILVGKRVDHQ